MHIQRFRDHFFFFVNTQCSARALGDTLSNKETSRGRGETSKKNDRTLVY